MLDAIGRADEAYKAGRWAEARAQYEALLARRPELSRTLHEQIARSHGHQGDHPKEMERLQALIDADPADESLRLWMAQEAIKGGMLDRARALLATIDPAAITDANVYFDIAALLINRWQPEEAIGYLTRGIALDGGHVEGYLRRGLAYLQLGRLADAKADLRKVVELAPDSPQAQTATKALAQLP